MERKRKWTIAFDLDGSLETPYFDKDDSAKVWEWMMNHPCGYAFERLYAEVMDGLPHFMLNGALELLRWVHDKGFENFMRDCFGLDPDIHKIEISCEHWSIPVKFLI